MYVSADLNRSFDHNYRSSIIFKTKSKQSLLSFRYLSGFQKLSKSSIMQLLLGIFGEWIKLCLDLMGLQNSFSMLFDPTKQTTLCVKSLWSDSNNGQTTLILYILIANVLINRRENIILGQKQQNFVAMSGQIFIKTLPKAVNASQNVSRHNFGRGFTDKNQNLGQKQIVNLKTGYNGFIRNQTLFIKPEEEIDQKVKLPHLIQR